MEARHGPQQVHLHLAGIENESHSGVRTGMLLDVAKQVLGESVNRLAGCAGVRDAQTAAVPPGDAASAARTAAGG
jgi:hypothetical protein